MDYGHALEFGIFITPSAEQPDGVVALAELADEAGLDLVSFQDHPYQRRFLETPALLSYVAARTRRVRLAPNVLNVPLRTPQMIAKQAASLDVLSGGRAELGLGAGAFWDGIARMGGPRLSPGESVDALSSAIDEIRAEWEHSAPPHPIGIWLGAYKPRMLRLTGRKADGWLPSTAYLEDGQLQEGNATIDAAARKAGRDPADVRRLLNVMGDVSIDQLVRWATDDGMATFILAADDAASIQDWATRVAPAVRERVEAARAEALAAGPEATTLAAPGAAAAVDGEPRTTATRAPAAEGDGAPDAGRTAGATDGEPAPGAARVHGDAGGADEYARLGVTPTPDDGERHGDVPWDEAARPHRAPSGPDVEYSDTGRQVGQHLVDVHDQLRAELTELRDMVEQVRTGALSAGDARSGLQAMSLRQNDWTIGAFCSRYCRAVAGHHGLEDDSIFPHLRRADDGLVPVLDRLHDEHLVIHDAIDGVDRALVAHINDPGDFTPLQHALDLLTDTLLSHLSYEEHELVEPLARLGFYAGQV